MQEPVFLGSYTPEAIGDYIAGPNHVLPTMGLARFTSSLSAENILKKNKLYEVFKRVPPSKSAKMVIESCSRRKPSLSCPGSKKVRIEWGFRAAERRICNALEFAEEILLEDIDTKTEDPWAC